MCVCIKVGRFKVGSRSLQGRFNVGSVFFCCGDARVGASCFILREAPIVRDIVLVKVVVVVIMIVMIVMIVEIPITYRGILSRMRFLTALATVSLSLVASTVKNLPAGDAFLTLLIALAILVKKSSL